MLQTVAYLVSLALAIAYCYSRPSLPLQRLAASLACIAVTWFYILRFTFNYDGPNVFDAAYADVIWGGTQGNWGYTQMLLTWAIVAMVWSHEAPCAYQVFGVFGAMSASFLVYRPKSSPSSRVPISYLISSAVGFWCTWMLPGTERSGTAMEDMAWWLWGLHLALLVPKFLPYGGPEVDLCAGYLALALLCFLTNIGSTRSPWPQTDCQISITVDFVVCTVVTLVFAREACGLYWAAILLLALLATTLSPGCVLALVGAIQQGLPRRAVTLAQRSAAMRRFPCTASLSGGGSGSSPPEGQPHDWLNLGYWRAGGKHPREADDAPGGKKRGDKKASSSTAPSTEDYADACRALATLVGKAAGLKKDERVLCVGCGRSGAELRLLSEAFGLASATGLDSEVPEAESFKGRLKRREAKVCMVRGLVEDIGCLRKTGFRYGDFDKVLAIDCIYHCDKARFFSNCSKLLSAKGGESEASSADGAAVAFTDVVLADGAPLWVRAALLAMNIPLANHWTRSEYKDRLAGSGLALRELTSLEPHVLAQWPLPAALRKHLDYVLVSASVSSTRSRPTAAIIGSGMSGCVVARRLSETHDVTIFEAGPDVTLAGGALEVDGLTVDVPLRMIGPCYYETMSQIIKELGIPVVPIRFEVCFFDAARAVLYLTHLSNLRTVVERLKYFWTIFRLFFAITFFPPPPSPVAAAPHSAAAAGHGVASAVAGVKPMTFGAYMLLHGLTDTEVYRVFLLPHLSWMLSCDYSMVEGYPAVDIIALIGAGHPLLSLTKSIVRISPYNKAIQNELVEGLRLKVNTRVGEIGQDKTINGESFDVVVVATEAPAVPKLLASREWASIFSEFKYHKSHVILHRDEELMPKAREDWRVINVRVDEKEHACMLSVWMNAYYGRRGDGSDEGDEGASGAGAFKSDVFQSWNTHSRPKEELVIRESHFQRVVQTPDSRRLQRAIAELQGKDGLYFAGSYAVPGLGLLEEASRSAEAVVAAVLRDHGKEELRRSGLGGADARL